MKLIAVIPKMVEVIRTLLGVAPVPFLNIPHLVYRYILAVKNQVLSAFWIKSNIHHLNTEFTKTSLTHQKDCL